MDEQDTSLTALQELQPSAVSGAAESELKSMMLWAVKFKRNENLIRQTLLERAKNEYFASSAIYHLSRWDSKKRRDHHIYGLTVDCAKEILVRWKNVRVVEHIISDTPLYLVGQIQAHDVESNIIIPEEFIVHKTKERTTVLDGETVLSERVTPSGARLFTVRLQDHELNTAYKAARAKALRNVILSIIPSDLKEELFDACMRTNLLSAEKRVKDHEAITAVVESFKAFNVSPEMLESYLGHSVTKLTPQEYTELRGLYRALKTEGYTWESLTSDERRETGTLSLDKIKESPSEPTPTNAPSVEEQPPPPRPQAEPKPKPQSQPKEEQAAQDKATEEPPQSPQPDPGVIGDAISQITAHLSKLGLGGRNISKAYKLAQEKLKIKNVASMDDKQLSELLTLMKSEDFARELIEKGLATPRRVEKVIPPQPDKGEREWF